MKFVKRITVFFIVPMVMFAGGFAASTAIMEFFYPGRAAVEQKSLQDQAALIDGSIPEVSALEPEAVEVSIRDTTSISADTVYVIQEYDRISGVTEEETLPVPETFIGMDRELFTQTMEEFNEYPSLSEQEKGFVGCEVVSFSPQRVIVRKTYEEEEMQEGFYLVNENNFVTVYYGDMETVYMNTNIWLQRLPEELQQEVLYIKFMETEEELFGFLEAYSS